MIYCLCPPRQEWILETWATSCWTIRLTGYSWEQPDWTTLSQICSPLLNNTKNCSNRLIASFKTLKEPWTCSLTVSLRHGFLHRYHVLLLSNAHALWGIGNCLKGQKGLIHMTGLCLQLDGQRGRRSTYSLKRPTLHAFPGLAADGSFKLSKLTSQPWGAPAAHYEALFSFKMLFTSRSAGQSTVWPPIQHSLGLGHTGRHTYR